MTTGSHSGVVAIVLAGGESRRFGSDKLAAELDGRRLLDHAIDGLPGDTAIAVVGPARSTERAVTFVREDPPGGGPAAGLVAGLRWALSRDAPETIVTFPGDAPGAGRAAALLAEVRDARGVEAVVGIDAAGREQVLQLALSPDAARRLVDLAGPGAGRDQSLRRMVACLEPPPIRHRLPDDLVRDIDTTDQLAVRQTHLRNPNRA